MEAFYAKAKQADVLIYSSTIDGELQTMEELLERARFCRIAKRSKRGRSGVRGKICFRRVWGWET